MKSWIFIGILLSLLVGAAYFYYNTTQERIAVYLTDIATLSATVSTLETALAENLKTINDMQEDFIQVREAFDQANIDFQIIRQNNRKLIDRLNDLDVNSFALSNPSETETVLNELTTNSFRCFEILSGAPLTSSEMEAISGEEFNPECPWLWSEIR